MTHDTAYYTDWERRARLNYTMFDDRELYPAFRPYLHSDVRVRVTGLRGTRTGTIGVTTGWRPAFLLMRRSSSRGSGDVISREDRIVAVQRGRRYMEVPA